MRQRLGGSSLGGIRGFSLGNVKGLRAPGVGVGSMPSFSNVLFSMGSPRVHGRYFMGQQARGLMSSPSFWGRYHALKGGAPYKGVKWTW